MLVNSSRSGTVRGSFDTVTVVGLGPSSLLIVVSSVICLSEIVLRICSVFANWAWFQIEVNAEQYASNKIGYALALISSPGKVIFSSKSFNAAETSWMNFCV